MNDDRSKFLFIDIETIPPNELEDFVVEKSPPKNIKDPVKIEQWYIDAREDLFRRQSVDTNAAKVLTIGAAFNDSPASVFFDSMDYSEEKVMREFEEYFFDNIEYKQEINGRVSDRNYDPIFIGVGVKRFDLQILFLKSLRYDLKFLAPYLEAGRQRYSKTSIDLETFWSGAIMGADSYVSMVKMMRVLGVDDVSGAEDFDGSMVYDAFKAGEINKIVKYNEEDVIRTREIFNKIKHSIGY